jgi:hypothetical protein
MTRRLAWAALLALASAATAVGQQLPSSWIADPQSGCRAWNSAPRADESVTWEGPCVDGYVDGKGVLQWFTKGVLSEIDDGEFKKGKLEGYAVMTSGPDFKFEGEFRDHLPNGPGTMHDADGQVYSGQWINGCFSEGGRRKAFGVGASCDFQS